MSKGEPRGPEGLGLGETEASREAHRRSSAQQRHRVLAKAARSARGWRGLEGRQLQERNHDDQDHERPQAVGPEQQAVTPPKEALRRVRGMGVVGLLLAARPQTRC